VFFYFHSISFTAPDIARPVAGLDAALYWRLYGARIWQFLFTQCLQQTYVG